ncbi:MAG: tRNA (adenosine(37)-N6)-threonylcarbamoyltransferase complex dimerization subunit type 1 TsaB [Saprospirales bacterium]|nr:MAG: tRNA (adenosine(37)-N6)-threonylcarbamoyltransferase complex dimerization subunit type 1 TsaB [Saprospirales bacterium]
MNNDPTSFLLCMDTAENDCSVALMCGTEVLAERVTTERYKHSEKLGHYVREVMMEANFDLANLTALVITAGPGSYTGLRVGFAMIKSLSWVSKVPIIGVETTEAIAYKVRNKSSADLYLPMMDARRLEVYTATYDTKLEKKQELRPVILSKEFFKSDIFSGKSVAIAGSGAEKCTTFPLPDSFKLLELNRTAADLAEPALRRIEQKKFEDPAYFEPIYLKEARITQSTKNILA